MHVDLGQSESGKTEEEVWPSAEEKWGIRRKEKAGDKPSQA